MENVSEKVCYGLFSILDMYVPIMYRNNRVSVADLPVIQLEVNFNNNNFTMF